MEGFAEREVRRDEQSLGLIVLLEVVGREVLQMRGCGWKSQAMARGSRDASSSEAECMGSLWRG